MTMVLRPRARRLSDVASVLAALTAVAATRCGNRTVMDAAPDAVDGSDAFESDPTIDTAEASVDSGLRNDGPASDVPLSDGNCVLPDGASANTQSDPRNCGACGHVCQPPASSCYLGCCWTPHDCGGDPSLVVCCLPNGTVSCIDVSSDPQNCGMCGNACPATETCSSAVCS